MVEAVFWDVGGVILDPASVREAHEAFVRRVVESYAPDASVGDAAAEGGAVEDAAAESDAVEDATTDETAVENDAVEDAIETWRTAVGEYFRARDGTEFRPARTAYHRAVAEVCGEPVPESEWRPLFESATAETLRPEPGAVETVERLAAGDLHVGVLSDVDTEEGLRILELFGVRDRFDSITTSEMVGRTKPDRRMFETALREASIPPDEAERAVMIGDRYEHDVAGAKRVGLTTVAYGADDGPAVDHRVEDLREVLSIPEIRASTDGDA